MAYNGKGDEFLPDGTTIEWFSASKCRWKEQQVKWILVYLDLILAGYWPDSNEDFKSGQRSWRAFGETARLNGVEVDARLGKTGRDGDFCLAFYHGGISQDELARLAGMRVEEIGKRISRVIKYISGWSRRERTYEEFVKHKKRR